MKAKPNKFTDSYTLSVKVTYSHVFRESHIKCTRSLYYETISKAI